MKTPTIPTIQDLTLNDLALQPIVSAIEQYGFKAFGEAQRLNDTKDKRTDYHPGIYYGGQDDKQYLSVFPDSHILSDLKVTGFSFFDIIKTETKNYAGLPSDFIIDFGIVVWFDFRRVYPSDHKNRTVENVISDLIAKLDNTRMQRMSIEKRVEKIYLGYTITEINNQFLMRPFGGFRINGSLKYSQTCI